MKNNHIFTVERSNFIKGIEWQSELISYFEEHKKGDSFPMTWAADGEIYTSAGDPNWTNSEENIEKKTANGQKWSCFSTGLDVEKFRGKPPDYEIEKVNEMGGFYGIGPYGPKPTGMISVDGKLYLAVQNLKGHKIAPNLSKDYISLESILKNDENYLQKCVDKNLECQHGSDATILCSDDFGKTWRPEESNEIMFPGYLFGGPSFINFGKDNNGSRDDFVYAVSTDQWDNGSDLRLGRVQKNMIQDIRSWEWVCGFKESKKQRPVWSKNINHSIPVLRDNRYISIPDMVYLSSINRYLLLTWHLNMDFNPWQGSQLIIYESPEPWGPFFLCHHEDPWENKLVTPYCPKIPLKWIESDGITGWLHLSGAWNSWSNSIVSLKESIYYRSNIRKFRLKII